MSLHYTLKQFKVPETNTLIALGTSFTVRVSRPPDFNIAIYSSKFSTPTCEHIQYLSLLQYPFFFFSIFLRSAFIKSDELHSEISLIKNLSLFECFFHNMSWNLEISGKKKSLLFVMRLSLLWETNVNQNGGTICMPYEEEVLMDWLAWVPAANSRFEENADKPET